MKKTISLKRQIFLALEPGDKSTRLSRSIDIGLIILITLNIAAVILATVRSVNEVCVVVFFWFEVFSVFVFSIEYLLRVWTAPMKKGFSGAFKGRVKYIFSFMALIDLAAVLPFYIPMLIHVDLRFLRILRLLRLLRVLKIGRYSESFKMLKVVLREKKAELMLTGLVISILIVMSSSVMYFVENSAQPDDFCSIPEAMWWSVSAITSVGYGDVYPITALGKFLGSVIAILGIGLIAMPTAILAAGFNNYVRRKRKETGQESVECPKCGEIIRRNEQEPEM